MVTALKAVTHAISLCSRRMNKYFDSATNTLVVVNLTRTCNIINISASFVPQLISVSQGQGIYTDCGCPEMSPQLSYFTTATLGISTEGDNVTEQSIPLIPVVAAIMAMAVVVMAIFLVILVITM